MPLRSYPTAPDGLPAIDAIARIAAAAIEFCELINAGQSCKVSRGFAALPPTGEGAATRVAIAVKRFYDEAGEEAEQQAELGAEQRAEQGSPPSPQLSNAGRRFHSEAELLATCTHPNVVRCLGMATCEGQRCLLFPLAERGNLRVG